MRVLRYYGIGDVRAEEVEKPVCGEEDVLIRVAYAGICGSDLHIYNKGMFIQNIPETMGHEFDGIVEQVGSEVRRIRPGDKVTANPMVPCGVCESCRKKSYNTCEALGFIGEVRPGCFAEYITMPEHTVIAAPPDADLKLLAVSEPLAVAIHICSRADFQEDDSLAIIGAGPIGLLTAALASQIYRVKDITVVDLSEERLKLARALGASRTVSSLQSTERFCKVVEAAGAPATFNMAMHHVEANGFVYVVSIFEKEPAVDVNALVASQVTLAGCNVYTKEDLEEAVQMISEKRIDIAPVISWEYSLEDGKQAFERLVSKKDGAKLLFKIGRG